MLLAFKAGHTGKVECHVRSTDMAAIRLVRMLELQIPVFWMLPHHLPDVPEL